MANQRNMSSNIITADVNSVRRSGKMTMNGGKISNVCICLELLKKITKLISCLDINSVSVRTKYFLKFRVFWDVASCSNVEVHRRFRGAYASIIRATHLWNVGSLQRDYTVLHPRRL
jgi:hypothetical protein